MNHFKAQFPIFTNHPELVYLDSAATTQKPQPVIDAISHFYANDIAPVHRGIYALAQNASAQFEAVRTQLAQLIGANTSDTIIFTSGATASLNMVAYAWGRTHLKPGDIILLSEMEHHANFIPWQRLRDDIGVELRFIPVTSEYRLPRHKVVSAEDNPRVKLLALTHLSHVLGTINPIREIANDFPHAKLLVDAAQSLSHIHVNVAELGADFLACSAHKMFGPSGVGALYIRDEIAQTMEPFMTGGHMIERVTRETTTWAQPPAKFEPGTPNIEGVIGFGAAIRFVTTLGIETLIAHEKSLTEYALERLQSAGMRIIGPNTNNNRSGIISFEMPGLHPHDAADILNRDNIALRAGHHCAQPLMQALNLPGTLRASLHLYNTIDDIDALLEGLTTVTKILTR